MPPPQSHRQATAISDDVTSTTEHPLRALTLATISTTAAVLAAIVLGIYLLTV